MSERDTAFVLKALSDALCLDNLGYAQSSEHRSKNLIGIHRVDSQIKQIREQVRKAIAIVKRSKTK